MQQSYIFKNTYSFKVMVWVGIIALTFLSIAQIQIASAADLTSVKDEISDSDVSVGANHTITFTLDGSTALDSGETITVTLPSGFTVPTFVAAEVGVQVASTTETIQDAVCSTTDTIRVTVSGQVVTFEACSSYTAEAAGSTVIIKMGTHVSGSNQVTNHASAASYDVTLAGTVGDTGTATITIVDDIAVTATVANSFTFAVSAVASGQTSANGESGISTTSVTTTATSIPWGTLASGTAKVARQDITVTTNANNGFTVGIFKDQDLTNNDSDTINIFADGVDGAAASWAAPSNTNGSADTFGHMGITSDDATLGSSCGTDTFGTALYDAIPTATTDPATGVIEVLCNTGPADGTGVGAASVGFKIEIGSLQEAGSYSNTLSYIATPTF